MQMIALSRRRALAGGGAMLLAGCQPENLKLSDFNPLARRDEPARPLDRVLAAKAERVFPPEQRATDLAEALSRGDVPGFAAMPDLAVYANGVMTRLARPLDGLRLPLGCEILACRDPGAFAYPSGVILLTHGLFREVDSEDALAFLIGHEIAHVALGHHDSGFLDRLRSYAMLGVETYFAFKLAREGGAAGFPGWIAASYAANFVGRDLISPSWTRSQEDDADRMAIDLMVAAGYNVAAVAGAMDLLHRAEHAFGYRTSTEFTLAEEALIRENEALKAQSAAQAGANPLAGALTGAIEGLSGALDSTRRNHRPPAERAALAQAYMDAEYPDAPEPAIGRAPHQAALTQPVVADAFRRYEAAQALRRDHGGLALRQYDERIRALTQGAAARDGYIQHAVAASLVERRQIDRAMSHYSAATDAPRPGALAFLRVADWHANSRRPRDALAQLARFVELYAESGPILLERLRYHRLANMSAETLETLTRCTTRRPELARQCQRVMAEIRPLT
jgi:predicted Zn-dependent protease